MITSPADGATLAPGELVVEWDRVISPSGIEIAQYQVLVTADEPREGNPVRVADIMLPASVTRLPIAAEFLEPGTYKTEVLAVEANGNQTLSEVAFTIE